MNMYPDIVKHLRTLWRQRLPGQLIIQLTDSCNASCPQCGMRVTEPFDRSRLSTEYVKRILDAAIERGVQVVSFTGGEPFLLLDDLVELITYAGQLGIPYIRTGTNGYIFRNPHETRFQARVTKIAERLAATPLRNLWISVDSAVPTIHEHTRGFSGISAGIERALPIFHDHGIYPTANLGITRNITERTSALMHKGMQRKPHEYLQELYYEFRTAFHQFYQFVLNQGFTLASACYPMSVNRETDESALKVVYAATSEEDVVRFSRQEKASLYRALLEIIPEFRSKLRIVSPLCAVYGLYHHYLMNDPSTFYPCRGGLDFFFIDAREGNTYPCGYRGRENLGKFWDLDFEHLGTQAACAACDWECFRDPSQLAGPVLQGVAHPLQLYRKIRRDPAYFRLWLSDLRYYRACDLFDGRKPPDLIRLQPFFNQRDWFPGRVEHKRLRAARR